MCLLQWVIVLLILVGLNWWLKPLKCHPKDPNSQFSHVLKLLFRSSVIEEQQSLLPSQPSDNATAGNDDEEMVEYHHLSAHDPSEENELSGEEL